LIGKSKKPRALKDLNPRVYLVMYIGQSNAWMDCDLFQHWFNKEFVPEVKKYLKGRDLPVKALLLMDIAPCHLSPDVLKLRSNCLVFACKYHLTYSAYGSRGDRGHEEEIQ